LKHGMSTLSFGMNSWPRTHRRRAKGRSDVTSLSYWNEEIG
jgi:hypothetical protein